MCALAYFFRTIKKYITYYDKEEIWEEKLGSTI